MKKIISICAVALLFASCSNDDDSQDQEFFNLKEGNLWVYKQYTVREDGSEIFHGTDTVTVIGQETIEGKVYFKLSHSSSMTDNEFFRVDEKGHLINERNVVIHPGTDMEYKYTYLQQSESETYGEMHFGLEEPKDINVEGNSYTVYPYVGFFDSFHDNIPEGIGSYKYYQPGLGMIVDTDRYLTGNVYIQKRLVHYELK